MKIAFTLCSNNYLAQAKTLGDSLIKHNPDYKFIIGLVDNYSTDIDYSFFSPHTITPVSEIGINDFDSLWKKYNIIELNTCVKASFLKYLFRTYPEIPYTFYFDPDIMIFHSLANLENEFISNEILLTPHILSPIPINQKPPENSFLKNGIYNLGFIGIKNKSECTSGFLNWWEERTLNKGFINPQIGLFVDQKWINFIPVFYDKVKILKSFGYNAAPWNLQERKNIKNINEKYVMEDNSILTFYHFSAYNYLNPSKLSYELYGFNFDNCPLLISLYNEYHKLIKHNKIEQMSKVPCFYVKLKKEYDEKKYNRFYKRDIKRVLKSILPPFITDIFKTCFHEYYRIDIK